AAWNTDLAKRNYWPQIALTGETGYHNSAFLGNGFGWTANQYNDWSALVTLTYTIWDWGIQKRQMEVAHRNELVVGSTGDQALLDLGNDLRNVMLQLRTLRENVRMTRELLVLQQQSYALLEAEYRNGRATYLDLIGELKFLIDARSRFSTSYFSLK